VVVPLSDTGSTDPETLALPGDGLREGIVQRLRDSLGEGVVDSLVKPGDDVWVRVSADAWRAAGMALRDVIGCEYFCFLSAIDWMPSPYGRGEDDPTQPPPERDDTIRQGYAGGETRMQIFARVTNVKDHFGVTIKADIPDDQPVVDSWISVYAGANWHEREIYDMMGIKFNGHPNLRRILMWDGYPFFPLRKDFPLQGLPSEMPDVAFTKITPLEGGPFVTVPSTATSKDREPRARAPEL